MNTEQEALRIADALDLFYSEATQGKWGQGRTTHETIATRDDGSTYKVGEFRHAVDAAFVDCAHHEAPAISAMLRKLVAEREADRAAMREALEAALHVTDCANRNEYGDVVLVGSLYNPEHLDAAITHLRQRLEGQCGRVFNGHPCSMPAGSKCPDCGPAVHDFPEGS